MQSVLTLFALLSILLLANTSYARPGYWHVMNGEAMPLIQAVMDTTNFDDLAFSNKKIVAEVVEEIVHEIETVAESDMTADFIIGGGSQNVKGKKSYADESDPIPDTTMAW